VGAGGSRSGEGIILARFFDSFFIEWKNECPLAKKKPRATLKHNYSEWNHQN
jgi:hypothetical protein